MDSNSPERTRFCYKKLFQRNHKPPNKRPIQETPVSILSKKP